MDARPALVAVLVAAAALASCGVRRGDPCYDSGDCEAAPGEVQACLSARCTSVECNTSADCAMGEVCDVDAHDCEPGCNGDLDCLAGSRCDDGQCVEYGCRSTVLDCDFGRICDADSGECVEPDAPFCAECSTSGNQYDQLGTPSTCDDVLLGNPACGGAGNYCIDWYFTTTPGCFVACETQDDCPAGFQCQVAVRPLPGACAENYLPLTAVCISDCSQ